MNWADISIGAGGSTTLERCYLRLPSIVISIADNQIEICKTLHNEKIVTKLGTGNCLKEGDLSSSLSNTIRNFDFNYLEVGSKLDSLINNIIL